MEIRPVTAPPSSCQIVSSSSLYRVPFFFYLKISVLLFPPVLRNIVSKKSDI